jgi:hypothetical protein
MNLKNRISYYRRSACAHLAIARLALIAGGRSVMADKPNAGRVWGLACIDAVASFQAAEACRAEARRLSRAAAAKAKRRACRECSGTGGGVGPFGQWVCGACVGGEIRGAA